MKLLQGPTEGVVESCKPNPCLNGGKCASSSNKKSCQCNGHFTGKISFYLFYKLICVEFINNSSI